MNTVPPSTSGGLHFTKMWLLTGKCVDVKNLIYISIYRFFGSSTPSHMIRCNVATPIMSNQTNDR